MKHNTKRTLALILSVMVALTALSGMAITVSADEATPTNAYVLTYEGENAKPYLYGSRYEFKHSYNDSAAGKNSVWTYWNCPEIFNLVNSETGASIAAYCTDADTSTTSDTTYRRINLEDSSYYAPGAAPRLRSVILNSFPHKSVEEVAAAATAAGYTVTELAQGELISATQQAIWKLAHGDKYSVDIHYSNIRSMSSYDESDFVYPESLSATETAYTASNMEALYQYFLSLNGTAPLNDAVSEYTFENVTYNAVQDGDDYTVTVTFDVNTTIDEGDSLTLSATCGNTVHTESLKSGKNTVTFTGLDSAWDVKLEINGYEMGGDVYLFDAEGDRTTSQSMIGYDASLLPVHAEMDLTVNDRTLTIHKATGDGNKIPLANIQFEVYYVGTLEDYIAGNLPIGAVPTEEEITKYATSVNLITTLTTNTAGVASHNFGPVDGVYLVKELEHTSVTAPAAPFFVSVSSVDPETLELDYTVDVYPKNSVVTEDIVIEKDVTEIDNDHDTFDIGQVHTWIIQSSIPTGMANGLKYEISDTLDYRLTYQGNILVTVAKGTDKAHSETVILEENVDYTVSSGKEIVDSKSVDSFQVSLTAAGMKKVAAAAATDPENTYEVRVYFGAVINTNADLGTEIPNQAHIDYVNNVGIQYEDDSDIPEVHTGGLNILKIASDNKQPLSGATFRIARPATEGEAPDLTITVNGTQIGLIYVDFYGTADLSGEKVSQITTGEDGTAVLYGLAYGNYYLVEIAAPNGYNRLAAPVAVEVTATSHLTGEAEGSYVTITNSSEFHLPETGGIGTVAFTVAGLALICSACTLFFLSYKRKAI